LAKQGIEADAATPEEFAKFVRAEVEKMAKIIKASGARPEQ
jgi:tripartite-type tricarboxylate transporter receptor subunit TctC